MRSVDRRIVPRFYAGIFHFSVRSRSTERMNFDRSSSNRQMRSVEQRNSQLDATTARTQTVVLLFAFRYCVILSENNCFVVCCIIQQRFLR